MLPTRAVRELQIFLTEIIIMDIITKSSRVITEMMIIIVETMVVGTMVVGTMVVETMVVGTMVVGTMVVGTMVVGIMVVVGIAEIIAVVIIIAVAMMGTWHIIRVQGITMGCPFHIFLNPYFQYHHKIDVLILKYVEMIFINLFSSSVFNNMDLLRGKTVFFLIFQKKWNLISTLLVQYHSH
jgi:hypothetical protein